jgi:imidazolonepropionase-like amidohydrolase
MSVSLNSFSVLFVRPKRIQSILESLDMRNILFANVKVFDAVSEDVFLGAVLIADGRIDRVIRGDDAVDAGDAQVIDCRAATLMPGLIEPHAHLSFLSSAKRRFTERTLPVEENLLVTAYNAKVLLDAGYTSAYSAGSRGPRFEIALKKEIDGGFLPGPRLIPSTFERGAYDQTERSGPQALREFVRSAAVDGAKSIKLLLSGDDVFKPGGSQDVQYTEEEVAAAADEAKLNSVWLAAHAQASDAVSLAARHGFRIIYHCTHADESALDQLEEKKATLFVAPAIGVVYAKAYLGEEYGFTREVVERSGFLEAIEKNVLVYKQMQRRGIRVLPGGDYGFPWNPIGENARDLTLFVSLFGYTPFDTLVAATKLGAELIGLGHELGTIQEGYLADLLLIDGNPLDDISILQDQKRILCIMQGGKFHKMQLDSFQNQEQSV